jgi:hypothetical protein
VVKKVNYLQLPDLHFSVHAHAAKFLFISVPVDRNRLHPSLVTNQINFAHDLWVDSLKKIETINNLNSIDYR